MALLTQLAGSLPLTLGAVALLLLLVVLSMRRLMTSARRSAPPSPGDGDGDLVYVDLRSPAGSPLARSFTRARRLLRRYVARRDRYQTPWFLLLGETWSGKTTLLEHTELAMPFGEPRAAGLEPRPGVSWWLFEQALVLDVLGAYVLRLDGDSSDDADWLGLLRLLRRTHPRRAIDGVVLTLPANLLVDPGKTTAELQNDAARRAGHLYGKLLQAELMLGMRFPVDVLVTKSDLIEGFTAFTGELPADAGRQMLGWSNPHPLDAPYQDAWIGQAFDSVTGSLERAAIETCVAGGGPACSADRLLFPQRLADAEPALQVYCNHLFAQGAYGVPFFFRGLYFCGGKWNAAAVPDDVCSQNPSDVLFLRDLFRDKVFAESGVATPTPRAESAARRRKLLLQGLLLGLVVLGGLALGWAGRKVGREAAALEPVVETLAGALAEPPATDAAGRATTERILAQSQEIERYEPRSIFLPASWFGSLDPKIFRVFLRGYERVVLPAARAGLVADVQRLDRTPTAPLPPREPQPAAVDQTPQFRRLAGVVDPLTALQAAADGYNCIVTSCAGRARLRQDFAVLTRYLYDTALDPPTYEARRFYGRLLDRASGPVFEYEQQDAVKLQGITEKLADELYGAVFRDNAVIYNLDRLAAEIEALEDPGTPVDAETYRELDAQIKKTAAMLAQPEFAWMTADQLDLGPEMDRLYAEIAGSEYLGYELRDRLEAEAEARFKALQTKLRTISTPDTGPLLAEKDGEIQLELSTGVGDLRTAVETLVGEPFMTPEPKGVLPVPERWQRLTWNRGLLQQATDLVKEYDRYVSKDLAEFPEDLRVESQQTALDSLETNMLHLIAQAENLQPAPIDAPPSVLEANLAARVKSFEAASDLLSQLLVDFIDLDLPEAYVEFAAVLDRQEYQLLNDAWTLLQDKDLYSPIGGDFSFWNGVRPPAPEAFGVSTAKGLEAYLANELAIVTELAEYARPVITQAAGQIALRDRDPDFDREYDRWNAILTALDLHKDKKAGNAVTTLESYVTDELQTVTLATCFDPIPPALEILPGNYFSDRQAELEIELHQRCETLARQQGYGCYRQAAQVFNERLAGRFPFSTGPPTPGHAEAAPAALREFFAVFDQAAALLAYVPEKEDLFSKEERAVRRFVTEMRAVEQFLGPFLTDAKKYPVPTFGFTVEFRVNQAKEVGAEDVIEWSLRVGEKTWTREQALTENQNLSGSWSYGTVPVILELRWAEDAPMRPVAAQGAMPQTRIVGRSVLYDYRDLWALIALMVEHRSKPDDFPTFSDPLPETLKFIVETVSAPTDRYVEGEKKKKKKHKDEPLPPSPPKTDTATLFVRISLVTPDRTEAILLPDVFPVLAPEVPEKRGSEVCPQPAPSPVAAPAKPAPPSKEAEVTASG